MYICIDVGGTKTIVASFSEDGQISKQQRFATPRTYEDFLKKLSQCISQLDITDYFGVVVGVPGLINRESGVVVALGNLPWQNVPLQADINSITHLPVILENDARLAGLAEAHLIDSPYSVILFLTISTGIGGALLKDGEIVEALRDTEMGKIPIMYDGKLTDWEDFASGRGVVNLFHQKADEVNDPNTWKQIGLNIAYGIGILCSVLQPEAIILGGPVGRHVDEYGQHITEYLKTNLHPVIRQPKSIISAVHSDEAVIKGCYFLAKMSLGNG